MKISKTITALAMMLTIFTFQVNAQSKKSQTERFKVWGTST